MVGGDATRGDTVQQAARETPVSRSWTVHMLSNPDAARHGQVFRLAPTALARVLQCDRWQSRVRYNDWKPGGVGLDRGLLCARGAVRQRDLERR